MSHERFHINKFYLPLSDAQTSVAVQRINLLAIYLCGEGGGKWASQ